MSHTPGPWTVGRKVPSQVFAENGNNPHGPCVADCNGHPETTREEDRANARLIAAAPEMLEALKKLLAFESTGEPDEAYTWDRIQENARAAIAKAEGR